VTRPTVLKGADAALEFLVEPRCLFLARLLQEAFLLALPGALLGR
jgi:hypothetical protein